MNKKEAAALVAMLVNAYPMAKFTEENAQVYEQALIDLDANDVQAAMTELVGTSVFLPSIAAIRNEVTRLRRERARKGYERQVHPGRLLGPGGVENVPRPAAWSDPLKRMLAESERHRDMAEPWYAERGKPVPSDPAKTFVDIAAAGAGGADVRDRVKREVLHQEEEERERYP